MEDLVEAFPRVGAQVDVVCKGYGKEGEEGVENEGGAHRGQYSEGWNAERDGTEGFWSTPSGLVGSTMGWWTRETPFSSWHRGVGICRVVPEREIIWRGHDSLPGNPSPNLFGRRRVLSKLINV